jgi:uncharacterized phage protein (TIGR01671 family)
MNREIKFRYIFRHKASGNIEVKHYYLNQLEERNAKQLSPCFLSDYELLSRDQYTGLLDDNGVEIYEADIVKNHFEKTNQYEAYDEIGVVKITNLFRGAVIADELHGCNYRYFAHSEVIGNIHENYEILER